MNVQDLQELYALARTAPLKQAAFAKPVAALFDRIEAYLAARAAEQAIEMAKAQLAQHVAE